MSYATVVVGTDGSDTAERAVRAAAQLAVAGGARLVVVTAYAEGDAVLPGGPRDPGAADEVARRGREVAVEAGAADVVGESGEGAPADVLLRAAEAHGADLVVVGAQGMSGPARFVLGGVANAVSHRAGCDVLLVHTDA